MISQDKEALGDESVIQHDQGQRIPQFLFSRLKMALAGFLGKSFLLSRLGFLLIVTFPHFLKNCCALPEERLPICLSGASI